MLTRQLSRTRMISSSKETKANPGLELMRGKSQSLHDLKRKVNEPDSDKLLPMADKIDDFLQTVNQQQEALNKALEERRRHKLGGGGQLRQTSTLAQAQRLSTQSTWQANINRKAAKKTAAAADDKRKTFQKQPLGNAISVIDASRITSKLKTDRNYQPPRKPKASAGQRPLMVQRKSMEVQEDYCDDFEPDNDEDNDDDHDDDEEEDLNAVAQQKEAWLYDQAIRGRARQKAALLRKQFYHEKESSKDSAYGFSGGENSRLHTREPTPDANNHLQSRLIHSRLKRPRTPQAKKPLNSLLQSGSSKIQTRCSKNLEMKEDDHAKIDFLNQVTREILTRGLYTEKAILKAVEGQMDRQTNLSLKQKADMVQKLKLNLGLDQGLKKQAYARTTSEESGTSPPPTRPPRPKKNPQAQIQISSPEPDDSLKSLLKDESDEEIVAILKSTRQKEKHPSKPSSIVHSSYLNLTNLNVSFNSSNLQEAKRKLEESRTQASLVKSFAYDKNETSEAEEDQLSHTKSSITDSSSSSVKSLDEKYESDFVEEEIESGSASEIQDEDLQS